jgi:hypothetical protein
MAISNGQIYDVLLEIKGDVGSLKASSEMQLQAIKNHGGRLVAIEATQAKQAGAARVWGLVATAAGALIGSVASYFGLHR